MNVFPGVGVSELTRRDLGAPPAAVLPANCCSAPGKRLLVFGYVPIGKRLLVCCCSAPGTFRISLQPCHGTCIPKEDWSVEQVGLSVNPDVHVRVD